MKKSGLKNRFPDWVRNVWQFDWFSCMVCHKNQWSALHHIISPSSRHYKAGEHNTSILNSCPIHNFGCHIDNEAWLNKNVPLLLQRTKDALDQLGYEWNENDKKFARIYRHLYEWRHPTKSLLPVSVNTWPRHTYHHAVHRLDSIRRSWMLAWPLR